MSVETKNFKRKSSIDSWGDFDKIQPVIIKKAQELRDLIGYPLIVTSGYRESKSSQHGLGLALDVIAPEYVAKYGLRSFFLGAEKVGFKGLGVYPFWKYNKAVAGGLHIDEREGVRARWMGVLDPQQKQIYIALNKENLDKYLGVA